MQRGGGTDQAEHRQTERNHQSNYGRHIVSRRFSLLMVLALALSILTFPSGAGASPASASTSTFTFKGTGALVGFYTEDGCTGTDVFQDVTSGMGTASGAGRTSATGGAIYISTFDVCDDYRYLDSLYCEANDDLSVRIDRNLTGGTVTGTFTCYEYNPETGEEVAVCTLDKSESLSGVGPTYTSGGVFRGSGPGYRYTDRFSGTSRQADVTAASLTGCGLSLTEADVQGAELRNGRSSFTFTSR